MDEMLSTTRRYWITIFTWVVVALLATGKEARGQRGVAGLRHFSASLAGEECSVFRTLARRTISEIEETKLRLKTQVELSQQRRAELVACAKSRGVLFKDEEQEALAAEVCPQAYDAWLSPGYRVQLAEEDLAAATSGYQTLQSYLEWNCRPLPQASGENRGLSPIPLPVSVRISNPPS